LRAVIREHTALVHGPRGAGGAPVIPPPHTASGSALRSGRRRCVPGEERPQRDE